MIYRPILWLLTDFGAGTESVLLQQDLEQSVVVSDAIGVSATFVVAEKTPLVADCVNSTPTLVCFQRQYILDGNGYAILGLPDNVRKPDKWQGVKELI
jgi:hypothetical protein